MTIDEAIKKANNEISQSQYLCECSEGVYRTGLNTVYENKADMLRTLLWHIKKQQADIEQLQQAQAERDNPQPLTLEQLRERDGKPVWCSVNKLYGVLGKRENEIVIGFSYGWDWLEDLISKPIYDYELKEQVKPNK